MMNDFSQFEISVQLGTIIGILLYGANVFVCVGRGVGMGGCVHVCVHVCMHVCMHVCSCVHACVHACVHMSVCMHACVRMCEKSEGHQNFVGILGYRGSLLYFLFFQNWPPWHIRVSFFEIFGKEGRKDYM